MGEYFRDELAARCLMKRPKYQGIGRDTSLFTGVAGVGAVNSVAVKYEGVGIFNIFGFVPGSWSTNFGIRVVGPANYSWSVLDQNLKVILYPSFIDQTGINTSYDFLDEGVFLLPNEQLIIEYRSFETTPRYYGGVLYGDEYLF